MTHNIIFIHGAYGNGKENWFPWLKEKLEQQNQHVIIPQFPTPENQSLTTWQAEFEKYAQYVNNKTIFVGHSIGCAFILNILEQIDQPIHSAFLAAPFISLLNNPIVDPINSSFVEKAFDWRKIQQNCQTFYLYGSDNDPYVPLVEEQKVATNLNAALTIVNNAGHFNEIAGYLSFEKLLTDITAQCSK